jgi:hypothetical protein
VVVAQENVEEKLERLEEKIIRNKKPYYRLLFIVTFYRVPLLLRFPLGFNCGF